MIMLTSQSHIWLATKPADFRCGIDGLAALCRQQFKQDPRNGHLFVFINRSRTMLRVLCYDGNGFWLITKRLSQGCFAPWPTTQASLTPVAAKALRALLLGADWQKA